MPDLPCLYLSLLLGSDILEHAGVMVVSPLRWYNSFSSFLCTVEKAASGGMRGLENIYLFGRSSEPVGIVCGFGRVK